jgi:hypothetical protein
MDDKPKLLDLVRNTIRLKHYSIRIERAYIDWVKRFMLFHHKRHPASMGAPEIRAFLSYLAVEGAGGRLYPNPGIKRSRFPVQRSSPSERRLAWEGGTSEEA